MKRSGITLVEVAVVLAIIGIMASILGPVFRRPARFYNAVVPLQHFEQASLRGVIAQLDQALQASRASGGKKPVGSLGKIRWQPPSLQSRRVTFSTQAVLPLQEVLAQLERAARIKISFGPGCGTCGSFDGPTTIRDAAA